MAEPLRYDDEAQGRRENALSQIKEESDDDEGISFDGSDGSPRRSNRPLKQGLSPTSQKSQEVVTTAPQNMGSLK